MKLPKPPDLWFVLGLLLFAAAIAGTAYTALQRGKQIEALQGVIVQQQSALRASESLRKADAEAILSRELALQAHRTKQEADNAALEQALQEHPAWSDSPVPDSIRNRLLN